MAIRTDTTAAPPMPVVEVEPTAPVWSASPGNVISTIHVTRTQHAYVAVEHPEGMTAGKVLALAKDRALDFAPQIGWWDAETETAWADINVGTNAPHDPNAEPFSLVVGAPAGE